MPDDAYYDAESDAVAVVIPSCAVGLGYLWYETPIFGTEALAIYSTNDHRLPAAPWKVEVELTKI